MPKNIRISHIWSPTMPFSRRAKMRHSNVHIQMRNCPVISYRWGPKQNWCFIMNRVVKRFVWQGSYHIATAEPNGNVIDHHNLYFCLDTTQLVANKGLAIVLSRGCQPGLLSNFFFVRHVNIFIKSFTSTKLSKGGHSFVVSNYHCKLHIWRWPTCMCLSRSGFLDHI